MRKPFFSGALLAGLIVESVVMPWHYTDGIMIGAAGIIFGYEIGRWVDRRRT